MKQTFYVWVAWIVLLAATPVPAQQPDWWDELSRRDALTNGLFGANDALARHGIELAFGTTTIYQQNVSGGLSARRHDGRLSGSYDVELGADLKALAGLGGGSVFVLAEGSWPQTEGITENAVGSFFGVNDDAGGCRPVDVTELWYNQVLLGGALELRAGKLDLTGGFDCHGCPVAFDNSLYANDETSQFLNGALVNNPSIPFPDNGLGLAAYARPARHCYVAIGMADAEAQASETGLATTFGGPADFFYVTEAGYSRNWDTDQGPLPGAYRLGLWLDNQDKPRFSDGTEKRDEVGFYLSCDQMVYRESVDEGDTQGAGLFLRYGRANEDVSPVAHFWSLGGQYEGLLPGRDADVLGLGVGQAIFTDAAGAGLSSDSETVMELYYNAAVAGWFSLTPSVQYVIDPAADPAATDAVVVAVRLQTVF